MLLKIVDESIIRRAVRAAIEADLATVVVVLGHEPDRARLELAGLACETAAWFAPETRTIPPGTSRSRARVL